MTAVLVFVARHWKLFAFGAAVLAALVYGEVHGYGRGAKAGAEAVAKLRNEQDNERVRFALEHAKAMEDQTERYRVKAESQAAEAQKYQEALNDANRKHDRTVADLRSGAAQLRKHWQGCEARVSEAGQAATGGLGADEGAELRAESAGRIVRTGAQCDAQVKSLQNIVRKDRQ